MGTGTPTSVAHGGDTGPSTDTGVIPDRTLSLGWALQEVAGIRRQSRALCHLGGIYSSDRKPKKAEVSLWSRRALPNGRKKWPYPSHSHRICVDPRQSSAAQGSMSRLVRRVHLRRHKLYAPKHRCPTQALSPSLWVVVARLWRVETIILASTSTGKSNPTPCSPQRVLEDFIAF